MESPEISLPANVMIDFLKWNCSDRIALLLQNMVLQMVICELYYLSQNSIYMKYSSYRVFPTDYLDSTFSEIIFLFMYR